MTKGTIRRLIRDRGFGFIRTGEEAGEKTDFFFHRTDLIGVAYESLTEGVTLLQLKLGQNYLLLQRSFGKTLSIGPSRLPLIQVDISQLRLRQKYPWHLEGIKRMNYDLGGEGAGLRL